MLLAGGTLDGARILDAATVAAAFTNQIGELDFPPAIATGDSATTADFNAGPGHKWGLRPAAQHRAAARHAGGAAAAPWAGLMNTHFWVDRASGVTGAIYTQTLPFVEPRVFQVYVDFERALYASLARGLGAGAAASSACPRRRARRR